MHPVFTSGTNLILYLMTWVPIGAMVGVLLSISAGLSWAEAVSMTVPLMVVMAFICLSPWYTCRYLRLGSTPVRKLLLNHLLAAVVLGGGVVLLAFIFAESLSGFFPSLDRRFRPAMPMLAGIVDLLYLLAIALHYVLLAVQSSREAEILAHEAELKALKAQINPHFLFNSLHSISALTAVDAAKAREMCIRLSDFLRTTLRFGERSTVPFSEEMALSRSYLDVEQVRFGGRLRVVQDIDEGCADCDVPPLLIQPLVENAVKHGIATLLEGGEIAMQGRRSADAMRFVIENPFDPEAPSTKKSGIGLANVRNRLQARYGAAARLEIEVQDDHYRVILWLPCKAARG